MSETALNSSWRELIANEHLNLGNKLSDERHGVMCISQTRHSSRAGGIGGDESWSRQTSRLLGKAWMLKRHHGFLPSSLSQSSWSLRWLVYKPAWQQLLLLLPGTSPCPRVLADVGIMFPHGLEVLWAPSTHWQLPMAVLYAGKVMPSVSKVCIIAAPPVLVLESPLWNGCFRGNSTICKSPKNGSIPN